MQTITPNENITKKEMYIGKYNRINTPKCDLYRYLKHCQT